MVVELLVDEAGAVVAEVVDVVLVVATASVPPAAKDGQVRPTLQASISTPFPKNLRDMRTPSKKPGHLLLNTTCSIIYARSCVVLVCPGREQAEQSAFSFVRRRSRCYSRRRECEDIEPRINE